MKLLFFVFVLASAAALVCPWPLKCLFFVEIFFVCLLFPFSKCLGETLNIQETYTETRDITDSAGNTFSCLYTIVYDPSRKVLGQFFWKYFTQALQLNNLSDTFSLQGGL